MQARRLTIIALAGSLVLAAGALGVAAFWPALARWMPAEPRQHGCASCGKAPAFSFDAALSPATNQGRRTLSEVLAPKPVWTDSDVDLIAAMMPMEPSDPAHDPSVRNGRDREAAMLHAWALGAVKERLTMRESLEPNAKARLVGLVVDRLAHPIVGVRYGACAAAIEGGLTADPAVEARVLAMADDPDRRVAGLARTVRDRRGPARGPGGAADGPS